MKLTLIPLLLFMIIVGRVQATEKTNNRFKMSIKIVGEQPSGKNITATGVLNLWFSIKPVKTDLHVIIDDLSTGSSKTNRTKPAITKREREIILDTKIKIRRDQQGEVDLFEFKYKDGFFTTNDCIRFIGEQPPSAIRKIAKSLSYIVFDCPKTGKKRFFDVEYRRRMIGTMDFDTRQLPTRYYNIRVDVASKNKTVFMSSFNKSDRKDKGASFVLGVAKLTKEKDELFFSSQSMKVITCVNINARTNKVLYSRLTVAVEPLKNNNRSN